MLLCPHCSARLDEAPSGGPTRCGACRLIVGPGRGVPAPEGEDVSGVSLASGALANVARRAEVDPIEPQVVTSALRQVAAHLGVRVAELRLVDYRHALAGGVPGPTLAEVMATFGTWRTARDAAAQG